MKILLFTNYLNKKENELIIIIILLSSINLDNNLFIDTKKFINYKVIKGNN
jgi:hypothetical protein